MYLELRGHIERDEDLVDWGLGKPVEEAWSFCIWGPGFFPF